MSATLLVAPSVPGVPADLGVLAKLAPGELRIAPNRMEPIRGLIQVFFYMRGNHGGAVELRLYDAAGEYVGTLNATLDGQGYGTLEFRGVVAGRTLGRGAYWVVATGGGVHDKRGFAVGR
jgi:hypothetical protein